MRALILGTALLLGCSGSPRQGQPPPLRGSGPTAAPTPAAAGARPRAPAPAPAPAAAPAPPRARTPGLAAEMQSLLDAHNAARAEHCAPPLAWSGELARVAQRWADSLRDAGCAFEHSGGSFGENLAAGTAGYLDPIGVVDMWVGERAKYDFARPGFSMTTGHFTQVVWRSTTQLGCGSAPCQGLTIWVCNYNPPGNMEGDYPRNVMSSSCRKAR